MSRKRSNQTGLRANTRTTVASILMGGDGFRQCFAVGPTSRNQRLITGSRILGVLSNRMEESYIRRNSDSHLYRVKEAFYPD